MVTNTMANPGVITKVLVADDHGVVRKGLRFLLQTDPSIEVVGEASDGRRRFG